jgi:hypothetical protein
MSHQDSIKEKFSPIQSKKRFGSIAVEKGFITPNQLIDALKIQVTEEVMTGKHTLLGKILLSQGIINEQQINEVLESQRKNPPYPSTLNGQPF